MSSAGFPIFPISTDSSMSAASEQCQSPILPTDIIHVIADVLALEDSDGRIRQRRLRREHYSKTLLNLRLVCREWCYIASPRLFRTLRLTHTTKSLKGFLTVMESPWIGHVVRSVRYQYWDPEIYRYQGPSPDDISERKDVVAIRALLYRTLSRLHEFPSLRSISIRFGEISPEIAELCRIRDDLSSILDALVFVGKSLLRPLESLSLTRLPPIHLAQYDHPAFRALCADLSFLEVHAASADTWTSVVTGPLPSGHVSPCEAFFYDTLPALLMPPPGPAAGFANLEALSLCFSDSIGVVYVTYSFSSLYFPRLSALRLQHVQFSVARDAERFVTQHGETLLELHLLHCQIVVAQNSDEQWAAGSTTLDDDDDWPAVPRPWSDIYLEFKHKLERLIFLDAKDAWWISFPDKYVAYSPAAAMQFLEEGREDDELALEKFEQTVKARAENLGAEYERELFSSSS
ncbi:hypothetical protein BC826DRAFT_745335 [Russula brevipes]|nr:hypothetical protein BC826DRAFT_745335 [Russula brevipes]